MNIALTITLLGGGVSLLGQDSFFLAERWDPEIGTLFQGAALYSLATGLILLGAFTGTVAYHWINNIMPMPERNIIKPHPAYKGALLVKFWYLALTAVVLILLAFLLADKAPNPSLLPAL
ncbi:MAG TPA: hypothetical protein PLF42_13570 [Anaerolineales bacterium]|nr:hypothetical protein [Anaerolineales bacterium]